MSLFTSATYAALPCLLLISCFSSNSGSRIYSTLSDFSADCRFERTYHGIHGAIFSPGYPDFYSKSICSEWFITGPPNSTVTFSFNDLDIPGEKSGICIDDFLHVGPAPNLYFCGSIMQKPNPYISKGERVRIQFKSNALKEARGFAIQYIINVPLRNCDQNEFRCSNHHCIYQRWRCNGLDECGDMSDEIGCKYFNVSTAAVTISPATTQLAHMSGSLDNAQLTCTPSEVQCVSRTFTSHVCLRASRVCDGIQDCLYGEDETDRLCSAHHSCRNAFYIALSGVIMSPRYPQTYPENLDCKWTISLSDYRGKIQIRFVDFNIGANAGGDHVNIYEGVNDKGVRIGRYGGYIHPPKLIESSSYALYITMRSTGVHTGRGFNMTYQKKGYCLPGQTSCGYDEHDCYVMTDRCNGHWDCPLHGGDERGCNPSRCTGGDIPCGLVCYNTSQRCDGLKQCPDGRDEMGCVAELCGPHNGTFLCANGLCIYELYRCDISNSCGDNSDEQDCSEFYNTMNSYCRKRYTASSGVIMSPRYPQNYPIHADCRWTISLPDRTSTIQIRFADFSIGEYSRSDHITIYEGTNDSGKRIGQFDGSRHPPKMIESTTHAVYITMHSAAAYTGRGFNMTYQKKGYCLPGQASCGYNERDCYVLKDRCNGHWDCPLHGGDERGCMPGQCTGGDIPCGAGDVHCYHVSQRCDGLGQCADSADEMDCVSELCGAQNGTFLCGNRRCIYEMWRCDQTDDCGDNTDEQGCPVASRRVIIAAVVGSLVCSLLLVVALGCTCKLYALRLHDQGRAPCHETPMSRLQAELLRRQAPPSYLESMSSSLPYDDVRDEFVRRLRHSRGRRGSRNRPPRPPPPQATDRNQISNGDASGEQFNNPGDIAGPISTSTSVDCATARLPALNGGGPFIVMDALSSSSPRATGMLELAPHSLNAVVNPTDQYSGLIQTSVLGRMTGLPDRQGINCITHQEALDCRDDGGFVNPLYAYHSDLRRNRGESGRTLPLSCDTELGSLSTLSEAGSSSDTHEAGSSSDTQDDMVFRSSHTFMECLHDNHPDNQQRDDDDGSDNNNDDAGDDICDNIEDDTSLNDDADNTSILTSNDDSSDTYSIPIDDDDNDDDNGNDNSGPPSPDIANAMEVDMSSTPANLKPQPADVAMCMDDKLTDCIVLPEIQSHNPSDITSDSDEKNITRTWSCDSQSSATGLLSDNAQRH